MKFPSWVSPVLTRLFFPTHKIVKNHRYQESDFTAHFTHWSPSVIHFHREWAFWELVTYTTNCLLYKGHLYTPRQPENRDDQDQPGAGFTKGASRHRLGAPAPQGLHRTSGEVSRRGLWTVAGFLVAKRMQVRMAHFQLSNCFLLWQPFGLVQVEGNVHRLHGKHLLDLHLARWPGLTLVCFWDHSIKFRGNTTEDKIFFIFFYFFRKLEKQRIEPPYFNIIKHLKRKVLFQRNKTLEST